MVIVQSRCTWWNHTIAACFCIYLGIRGALIEYRLYVLMSISNVRACVCVRVMLASTAIVFLLAHFEGMGVCMCAMDLSCRDHWQIFKYRINPRYWASARSAAAFLKAKQFGCGSIQGERSGAAGIATTFLHLLRLRAGILPSRWQCSGPRAYCW